MRGAALALASLLAIGGGAMAAEGPVATAQAWPFAGIFGQHDKAAARRGLQVYQEVCSACHSIVQLRFRHLSGIGFTEAEIKALAAATKYPNDPNDAGEVVERAGRPSDPLPRPFANEQAARAANNGAFPPDFSVIVKARLGGADYIYGLLTGYTEAPANMKMTEGMFYNEMFAGHQIAMTPPLNADAMTYADGTAATVVQMAYDVTSFLAWSAEPELDARKRLGLRVMLFLAVLGGLVYATKKKVWRGVH